MTLITDIITPHEREHLRTLANRQLALAMLPEMQLRSTIWTQHNDLAWHKPLVTIETRTFEKELLPPPVCTSMMAATIERRLQAVIVGYQYTHDDRLVPAYYGVAPQVELQMFDVPMIRQYAGGNALSGFSIEPLITDLERQFDTLPPSSFLFDQQFFSSELALAEDVFGDILSVRTLCPPLGVFLSKHLVELMGMEEMMYAFYDDEELMSQLIGKIADEYLRYFDYLEQRGLLLPNNDNTLVKMGTVGYTTQLPGLAELAGQPVSTQHLWGHLNSQETSSVSPEMFHDFFLQHYKRLAERFGLYTYGCCEGVDRVWSNNLDQMPTTLRKLSVSPWCNERWIGERLQGSNIIYHRKPHPNYIGVGTQLDEEAFAVHIKQTLQAAQGCHLEFSLRDIYQLGGNLAKPGRAVEIISQQIEAHWKP